MSGTLHAIVADERRRINAVVEVLATRSLGLDADGWDDPDVDLAVIALLEGVHLRLGVVENDLMAVTP